MYRAAVRGRSVVSRQINIGFFEKCECRRLLRNDFGMLALQLGDLILERRTVRLS
jgi:hypothetical protein